MELEASGLHNHEQCSKRSSDPAHLAYFGMVRLIERVEREIGSRLSEFHLNVGQMDVLLHVVESEGLTQQELAERLCHSKANVSQLLDKMGTAGLIRREPDGRAYAIFLTDEGRKALKSALPSVDGVIAEQFRPLSKSEQSDLFRLIADLDSTG